MSEGTLTVIAGRSRTGKTTLVTYLLGKFQRALVYDPKGHPKDFTGLQAFTRPTALLDALQRAGSGPGAFRLIDPSGRYFDIFCKSARAWLLEAPGAVAVDELSEVTSPGKAPPGWGTLCRTGMGFGVHIFALTQRPAESDKTCFGNHTSLVTFHMSRRGDRKYIAEEMDLDQSIIDNLEPFHFVIKEPGRPYQVKKIPAHRA